MNFAPPARITLAALLVFVSYMALSPSPLVTPISSLGDKFQHMSAFASLAMLSRLAYPKASSWQILERLAFFGALIEVFQAIPSLHRSCDWRDLVADVIALALTLGTIELATHWRVS